MIFSLRQLAALAVLFIPYLVQAGPYTDYTTTALIPWLGRTQGEFDFTTTPYVNMWISKDEAATEGLTDTIPMVVDRCL